MTIEELLKSPEEFKKWLNTKRNNSVVGYARNPEICPICNFIIEKIKPNDKVSVGAIYVWIGSTNFEIADYTWLKAFLNEIDENIVNKPLLKSEVVNLIF